MHDRENWTCEAVGGAPPFRCGLFGALAQGFVREVRCLRCQLRSARVLFKHKQFSVGTHFVAIGLSAGVLRK